MIGHWNVEGLATKGKLKMVTWLTEPTKVLDRDNWYKLEVTQDENLRRKICLAN